jgi:hypothetical protein
LGAQLLSSLAYQIANIGNCDDALLIAKSAVTGAPDATPLVRALLANAWPGPPALTHHADATRRALDAVDNAYTQHSPGLAEPEWVYWLDRAEIDVMAGRCLIELGAPTTSNPYGWLRRSPSSSKRSDRESDTGSDARSYVRQPLHVLCDRRQRAGLGKRCSQMIGDENGGPNVLQELYTSLLVISRSFFRSPTRRPTSVNLAWRPSVACLRI